MKRRHCIVFIGRVYPERTPTGGCLLLTTFESFSDEIIGCPPPFDGDASDVPCRRFGSDRWPRVRTGERAGTHKTFNSKNDTIQFKCDGSTEGRGRTALSTPITHPVQRSINSYTTATNDKRRGRLIYFIRSHHLPAISCPPWTLLIYFEWTKISDAHPFPHRLSPLPSQTKTTSPLKRKAPTELEMHAKPYGIKVRSSLEKPGEAGGHGWRISIRFSRAGGRSAHQQTFEGPGEALSIQISESQALCGKINFIRTRRRT